MGGGGSKPDPEQIRQISANLDLQFSGNCSPSASVQQQIQLNNVKIRARDDCAINFVNYATVNATCDMSSIIDAIAQLAVQADEKFAKALMSAQDAAESTSADIYTQQINVKKKLTAECHSAANAKQSLVINGAVLECTGNSQIKSGNEADVRATCLRTQLHNALTEASLVNEEPSKLVSKKDTQMLGDYAGIEWTEEKLMIAGFALLLVVLIVLKNEPSTDHNYEQKSHNRKMKPRFCNRCVLRIRNVNQRHL